jgi:hypothetical protein
MLWGSASSALLRLRAAGLKTKSREATLAHCERPFAASY